jgi:hypothetical protein
MMQQRESCIDKFLSVRLASGRGFSPETLGAGAKNAAVVGLPGVPKAQGSVYSDAPSSSPVRRRQSSARLAVLTHCQCFSVPSARIAVVGPLRRRRAPVTPTRTRARRCAGAPSSLKHVPWKLRGRTSGRGARCKVHGTHSPAPLASRQGRSSEGSDAFQSSQARRCQC